jgi:pimeloyl-ACP methyl ester carboxylesterase
MRYTTLLILATALLVTGCARLDDAFYDPSAITEYKLRNYTGEVEIRLDERYNIPDSLIHLFPILSKGPDETTTTKIWAVYIGSLSRISTDTVIMYCHGKKDHMDFYWPRAELLANTRGKNHYGVLMVDYRGYGLSEGKPTEDGLYADVDAGLNWLKGEGLTNDRLMMYGFSLGTAPATRLCAETRSMKPAKLLLEAPFASADAIVQDAAALSLYASYFTDLKINNAEEIKKVKQPLFWIHGEADDFLNVSSQGQVVYDHHTGAYKEAHRIPGAGHGDVPSIMGFDNYLQAVGNFIIRQQ